MNRELAVGAAFGILLLAAVRQPAGALPVFAQQYGVKCQKCHTVVPQLNAFGVAFAARGFRIPGVPPGPAFPLAVRTNLAASSVNQGSGPGGAGLPKAIVDEVELLAGGPVGQRGNYFFEHYLVNGGVPGSTREAWLNYRADPWSARIPVYVQGGSLTLPLPVDPETFRDTYQHYAIFDQRVGSNPFNFFDPKTGVQLSAGDTTRGANLKLFAGAGVMAYAQQVFGHVTLSAYRYTGSRSNSDAFPDGFERQGYALVYTAGRWTSESLLQTGWDSNADGAGAPSSGGFTQVIYAIGPRIFAEGRYEGTNDPSGFSRDGVLLIGYRPTHNSRLTIEDVLSQQLQPKSTINAQFTVAY